MAFLGLRDLTLILAPRSLHFPHLLVWPLCPVPESLCSRGHQVLKGIPMRGEGRAKSACLSALCWPLPSLPSQCPLPGWCFVPRAPQWFLSYLASFVVLSRLPHKIHPGQPLGCSECSKKHFYGWLLDLHLHCCYLHGGNIFSQAPCQHQAESRILIFFFLVKKDRSLLYCPGYL